MSTQVKSRYGARFCCGVCGREQRSEADADRCERDPLPQLPLSIGARIRIVNVPTNEERDAVIVGYFNMNGTRTKRWQRHYMMYTCRSPEVPYDYIVGVEDVVSVLGSGQQEPSAQ